MTSPYDYDQSQPYGALPFRDAGATNAVNIVANGNQTYVAQVFSGINVNTAGVTSTLKVYDGTDNTGKLLGTFDTTKVGPSGRSVQLTSGNLYVVAAGGTPADVTVFNW